MSDPAAPYLAWTEAEKGCPLVETPDGAFALFDTDEEARKVADRLNKGVAKSRRERRRLPNEGA